MDPQAGSHGSIAERRGMRRLLADHDTRSLLGSQWVSQLGDGVVQAGFANVLILEAEGTAGRFLAVSALTLIPYSVIAPFTGVLVDRWRRRSMLVGTNLMRSLLLIVLACVVLLTDNEPVLYAGLLLLLGLGRLFLTTKGAALPAVLGERDLLEGNSLSGGGGMIAALLGGVVGLGLIALANTAVSFFASAALYAGSSLWARRLSTPYVPARDADGPSLRAEVVHIAKEMVEGLRAIAERAAARLPLIGVFVVRTAAMVAAITAIIVIKQNYPDAGDRLGRLSASALALGTAGVGAFVGALVAPLLHRRFDEPRLMLGGFCLAGISIAALGGVPEIWAVLLLTALGGLGGFIAKVAVDAQVQRALPDDLRGRGFAVYDILFNLATVVAALLLLLAEGGSLRPFLIGLGLLNLLFAAALAAALKKAHLL